MSESGFIWIAKPDERTRFLELWYAYLWESEEGGSSLHSDEHNLKAFRDYFDAYASGELPGLTVFWAPEEGAVAEAVMMGGGHLGTPIWHDEHNGLASMWGIYVRPQHRKDGIALRLCTFAIPYLEHLGFSGASTTVRVDNPLGMAMRETLEKLAMIRPLSMSYVGYWDGRDE